MKLSGKKETSSHNVSLIAPFCLIVFLFLAAAAGILLRAALLIRHDADATAAMLLPYLTAICVLAAAAFLLIFLIYRPFLDFLKILTDYMKNVPGGNRKDLQKEFVPDQKPLRYREAADLSCALNDLMRWSDELNHTIFENYTKMYELETNNRDMEISFLRSQINPHFLYNTLTMISGMATDGETDKIVSIINALALIYRYNVKGNEMVTLREEMDVVRSYLMIQQERFGDRFSLRYEFWGDSMDCLIPSMIIQPLVENAIIHGLEKRLKPGCLQIGAGQNPDHGYLAIWIYDNGVGMPVQKLKALREALANSSVSADSGTAKTGQTHNRLTEDSTIGTGILNVNKRMVLYYGTDYSLLIDSEEGVGTNIQIRVPYRTE